MSKRITRANLEALAVEINRLTGSPATEYNPGSGTGRANVGHYKLTSAYGGHGLERISNSAGGVTSIIGGYRPKRELHGLMRAYREGLVTK